MGDPHGEADAKLLPTYFTALKMQEKQIIKVKRKAYFEPINVSISLAPFMRVATHAQKLQRKRNGAYLVRPLHVLRQEAWFQRKDRRCLHVNGVTNK